MKKKTIPMVLSLLLAFAAFVGGCGGPAAESVEPACTSGDDAQAVMVSAENVLRQMNFTIDKSDARQGYIRTRPLTGAQAFEFWRKDNIGSFNTAEANLQTIRRTVEINVSPRSGQLCADCVVTVERMSLPEREAVGATYAASMFTKSGPSQQRLELNPVQKEGMSWIDLGRDSQLEAEILRQLRARL